MLPPFFPNQGLKPCCGGGYWLDPVALAERKREVHRFHPPLDIVDGAARIVDPIFAGISTGEHVWGQFLKDYRITDW